MLDYVKDRLNYNNKLIKPKEVRDSLDRNNWKSPNKRCKEKDYSDWNYLREMKSSLIVTESIRQFSPM